MPLLSSYRLSFIYLFIPKKGWMHNERSVTQDKNKFHAQWICWYLQFKKAYVSLFLTCLSLLRSVSVLEIGLEIIASCTYIFDQEF